jgi:hypothetical protein
MKFEIYLPFCFIDLFERFKFIHNMIVIHQKGCDPINFDEAPPYHSFDQSKQKGSVTVKEMGTTLSCQSINIIYEIEYFVYFMYSSDNSNR